MTLLEHYELEREEGRKEGRKEGVILGAVETMVEDGRSEQEIIERIMRKYNLSSEKAAVYVNQVVANERNK